MAVTYSLRVPPIPFPLTSPIVTRPPTDKTNRHIFALLEFMGAARILITLPTAAVVTVTMAAVIVIAILLTSQLADHAIALRRLGVHAWHFTG